MVGIIRNGQYVQPLTPLRTPARDLAEGMDRVVRDIGIRPRPTPRVDPSEGLRRIIAGDA